MWTPHFCDLCLTRVYLCYKRLWCWRTRSKIPGEISLSQTFHTFLSCWLFCMFFPPHAVRGTECKKSPCQLLNCCLLPPCSTPNRWTPGLGLMWPAPPSSFSSSASSRLSSCHRESTLGNNTQTGPWKFEIYFKILKSLLWLQFKQL